MPGAVLSALGKIKIWRFCMKKIKDKLHKLLSICLAVLMMFFNVVSSHPITVKATSLSPAINSEATAEMMMILWNLMMNGMILSGVDESSIGDYEVEKLCFEGFMETLCYDVAGFPDNSTLFVLEDGRHIDIFEFMEETGITINEMGQLVDGTGALVIPDVETWEKYRVIEGGSGGDSEDPEDPEEPEPEGPFNHIESVLVGNGLITVIGDFISDLWNGEVEGIDQKSVFYGVDTQNLPVFYFEGYEKDDANNYIVRGTIFQNASSFSKLFTFNTVVKKKIGCVAEDDNFKFFNLDYNGYSLYDVPCSVAMVNFDSNKTSNFDSTCNSEACVENYSINLPVFDSWDSLSNYKLNGELAGLLNGVPYDFTDLVNTAPETLESLSNLTLNPNALPGITNSLSDTVAALPEPGTDPVENTNNFKSVLTGVLNDLIPGALADSDVTPDTGTEPDIDTSNYFGILGQILNAIKAIAESVWEFFSEPITAIKNGVLRIIEIIPEQIELVLGNIVTLPQTVFDLFSNPLLAIQEALALIPAALNDLWTRLEPYLESFKNSLQQPWDIESDEVPPGDGDGDDSGTTDGDGKHDLNFLTLLNGLFLLILILIMLLSIFVHCLEFIINIFKIEADTGFLPADMVSGLNYLKSLEIPGIEMSIYDFMMMLVYILIVFGVIKVLRKNINFIHVPKPRK